MQERTKIIARNGQSVQDVALQEYGTLKAVFMLLIDNKIGDVSWVFRGGEELIIRTDTSFNTSTNTGSTTNSNEQIETSANYVEAGYVTSGYIEENNDETGFLNKGISDTKLKYIA